MTAEPEGLWSAMNVAAEIAEIDGYSSPGPGESPGRDEVWRVMTPDEHDAYMAEHPEFAARCAKRAQELYEQYKDRIQH